MGIAQVGRGGHRQLVADAVTTVALQGDNCEVAFLATRQPMLAIDHAGVFADGHAVDDRHGVHAHKGAKTCRVEHRAVDIMTVGVGPVEYNEGDVPLGTSLHHIVQCGKVSVEAAAHILKVEKHHIHILHLLGGRLLVLAIEGDDGEARLAVNTVVYMCACRRSATETMLWAENLCDVYTRTEQGVDEVCCPHHRGLVGHHCRAAHVAAFAE